MSEETTKLTPFQKWYQNGGKEKLAERRKRRYHEDSQYRERCLKQSANSRRETRRELAAIPAACTLTHSMVAERLGVTQATMRTWRMRSYYPEPFIANGRLYFTENQLEQLKKLAAFFTEKTRRRLTAANKKILDDIKDSIYANWN